MSDAIIYPTTQAFTVVFQSEADTPEAFNPDVVTFTVVDRFTHAVVGTFVAGTDPEVTVVGSPVGTYRLVWTPPDRGDYTITCTGEYLRGDGQPGFTTTELNILEK